MTLLIASVKDKKVSFASIGPQNIDKLETKI